jgi:hypothetical protein
MKGQSLNIDALFFLRKVVRSPSLLLPHVTVPHIGYIDWKALKEAGIRGVVFDKGLTISDLL